MGNLIPVSPWVEGWQAHSSLGVNTTTGGYSDWFNVQWTIERGPSNYLAQAQLFDSGGSPLYTATQIDLGVTNGTALFAGYDTAYNNVGDTNIASFSKISEVNVDNFKIEYYPAKTGYEAFEETHNLLQGPYGDDDSDGIKNIYEFAFGGNPTNSTDSGSIPGFALNPASNLFVYIYMRPSDPGSGISTYLELSDRLDPPTWNSSGYTTVMDPESNGYQQVNNYIPMITDRKYVRLTITPTL